MVVRHDMPTRLLEKESKKFKNGELWDFFIIRSDVGLQEEYEWSTLFSEKLLLIQ